MKTAVALLLLAFGLSVEAQGGDQLGGAERHTIGLTITGRFDGSDRIRIDREGARWENVHWGLGRSEVRLNGVRWRPRVSKTLVNEGQTRFLHAPVDFSTARLADGWRGRDTVAVFPGEDAVVIHVADNPNGAGDYTFTVTFEAVSPSALLFLRGPIDGTDEIRIDAHGASWRNLHWGKPHGRVYLNSTPWEPRKHPYLRNRGSSRFLPDGVDFRSARVLHTSGRDLVTVRTAPDHVIVRVADTPVGASVYEILLQFGP